MDGIGQWVFFQLIFRFLDGEIETFRHNLMTGLIEWILTFGILMVTIWIIFQGWLIVTGRSREPMMSLVTQSMRVVLITLLASSFTFAGEDIADLLGNTLPRAVTGLVSVDEADPAEQIDQNLALMQLTTSLMDGYAASAGADAWQEEIRKATTMSTLGVAGPAVIGGALLLTYKVALALFVGLGPLFIMTLLFNSTKGMFSKWLNYGIGTIFSLAVLSFMVAVAMKMVGVVALAMYVKYQIVMQGAGVTEGINSVAMQQAGLGVILTVLLIATPPIAAMFFSGTLANFSAYSQFGQAQARDAQGNPVGNGGYRPSSSPSPAGQGGIQDERISRDSNEWGNGNRARTS